MIKTTIAATAIAIAMSTSAWADCSNDTTCVVGHPVFVGAGPNCYQVSVNGTVFALDYNAQPTFGVPSNPVAISSIVTELSAAAGNSSSQLTINYNSVTQHNCNGQQPFQITSVGPAS